jgi:hypothetical protein
VFHDRRMDFALDVILSRYLRKSLSYEKILANALPFDVTRFKLVGPSASDYGVTRRQNYFRPFPVFMINWNPLSIAAFHSGASSLTQRHGTGQARYGSRPRQRCCHGAHFQFEIWRWQDHPWPSATSGVKSQGGTTVILLMSKSVNTLWVKEVSGIHATGGGPVQLELPTK